MIRPENIPMSIFTRFLNDQSGATAIEYGLIAGSLLLRR